MAERIISILRKTEPTFQATDYIPVDQDEVTLTNVNGTDGTDGTNGTNGTNNANGTDGTICLKLFKPPPQTQTNRKIKKKRYDELDEIMNKMNLTAPIETKINDTFPSPVKPNTSIPRFNQRKKRGN